MPRLHSSSLDKLQPRRICLIKPSALGDVVQTLPLLAALRNHWPEAHIAWVINRSLAGLLEGHPQLDEVIPFDRAARGLRRAAATRRLAWRLYTGRFDLAIDMQGLLRSGLMTWATRAAVRVGMAGAREGARLAYTHRVDVPTLDTPAVERYWLVARALGCRGEPSPTTLGLSSGHRAWAATRLARAARPLLAIHPGARWSTKRWPPRHFAELAERAMREYGAGVVLVGGPGEAALCARIETEIAAEHVVNLAEQTNLLELAAILSAADVFLAGDTGPMHLAAALGTPVVAIFTCTSPLRAGPYGAGHQIVATDVACAASYLKTCPAMVCMEQLRPNRVWPALAVVLERATGSLRQRAS